MKPLINYIREKLIINKNYNIPYSCAPTSFNELRKIIEDIYDKLGPGTEQKPIDFNDIDVSGIRSFYDTNDSEGIFQGIGFKYIDVSKWNVQNVTNMCCTFAYCESLEGLDISNWNVSNVKNMNFMFYKCEKLKSVGDLSNWNISSVKIMEYMFKDSGITNIPDWYKG